MTTPPLDPSLDVSSRLAKLRTWQAEWQRIDHELEEQVSHLDGNNLLQLQQSVHLSNVRRRMEMTLVKEPLAVPESVFKHLGARTVRSQFAQQFAGLTREERLLWLNSFLFFMTADLRKLDNKIEKVRNYRSLGQTRNFLLGGESGMGKTTYLDWLIFNHMPVVEKERNRVPIIGIEAPVSQNTARPLLWRMLLECGKTYAARDNEEILLMKLVLYFQQCGVELLVIDEVQHIKRPELKRRVLEVSNMSRGIPIICAATHPIKGMRKSKGAGMMYSSSHNTPGPDSMVCLPPLSCSSHSVRIPILLSVRSREVLDQPHSLSSGRAVSCETS